MNRLLLTIISAIHISASPAAFAGEPPSLETILSAKLEVTNIDGSKAPLNSILATGKITIVEFWATWCPPCHKTIPALVELDRRFREQGVQVLGLSVDSSKDLEKVKRLISELGVGYTNAFASPEVFRFITGRDKISVPKIVIFNREGKIIKFITSYSFLTNRHIENAVKDELKSVPH